MLAVFAWPAEEEEEERHDVQRFALTIFVASFSCQRKSLQGDEKPHTAIFTSCFASYSLALSSNSTATRPLLPSRRRCRSQSFSSQMGVRFLGSRQSPMRGIAVRRPRHAHQQHGSSRSEKEEVQQQQQQ